MTAPSNANTSGLDVVAWRYTLINERGDVLFSGSVIDAPPREGPCGVDLWRVDPLVTAASAQAAIDAEKAKVAELEALVASYRKTADLEAQGCDAAEARVDRLAEIASKLDAAIAWLDYPFIDNRTPEAELRQRIGFMMKDAEPNRAALQQETQPYAR